MASQIDWQNLQIQLRKLRAQLGLKQDTEAFAHLLLQRIFGLSNQEACDAYTDGADDRGMDAIHVEETQAGRIIHLFQFKYSSKFQKSSNNFPANEIGKIISFLGDLYERKQGAFSSCNEIIRQKIPHLFDVLDDPFSAIRIHLCSNGEGLIVEERKRLIESISHFDNVNCDEVNLRRISTHLIEKDIAPKDIHLRFCDHQVFSKMDEEIKGVVATVRAAELADALADKALPGHIDERAFRRNVRVFLGFETEINNQIYTSAIAPDNARFWYLNNGITMICDRCTVSKKVNNGRMHVRNAQIVNGQQTCYALFEACRLDRSRMEDATVLVRVYETRDETLVAKIAETTNNQSRISQRDLRSNDEIQLKIEKILSGLGYYYERKKRQHRERSVAKTIDAHLFGQVCLSYFHLEPETCRTRSQDIFDALYKRVFHQDLDVMQGVAAFKVFRRIEEIRESALERARNGKLDPIDPRILVYGNFHILATISVILDLQKRNISDIEDIDVYIASALEAIRRALDGFAPMSAYELFRSAATMQNIRYYLKTNFDQVAGSRDIKVVENLVRPAQLDLFH